jgi:hypothetical protein
MALPQLNSVKYELTLPSTGEKVDYRPFLVKEEKALMIAQATGEDKDMLRAIENIIEDCTFSKLKKGTLPYFDIEYVFLQLRAKSIGESVDVSVTCPDDGTTKVTVKVNLETVKCVKEVGHDNKIPLTDTVGIIMNYPKVADLIKVDPKDTESTFRMIESCVHQIYDADNVYESTDMSEEELRNFIEQMNHEQFQKVQEFFDTLPKVKHPVKVKNPNTGVESEVVLEGMANFF